MRTPARIRRSGPYEVHSIADGTLIVHPKWPQFPPATPMDGGGPGLASRIALAQELQDFLNSRVK